MDPRVEAHARVLVEHSLALSPGAAVDVVAPPEAADLVTALYADFGRVGARPDLHWDHAPAERAYARELDPADAATPPHRLAGLDATDAAILIDGDGNESEGSDVPAATRAALDAARDPVEDARESTRWCLTAHPTPTGAQRARMSTEAYEAFVWDAVTLDWDAQAAFQDPIAERLDGADEVRVETAAGTDVAFSVAGMRALSDTGQYNLPGGEVFTAPVPESVEGVVVFDVPAVVNGRTVEGVRVAFDGGEATVVDADRGADAVREVLATDRGARFLGEFGVGTNRAVDRPTGDVLFDEKMGDTVHLAFGEPIAPCVPDGRPFNESVAHEDLVVDVSGPADRVLVDGDALSEGGAFWFE